MITIAIALCQSDINVYSSLLISYLKEDGVSSETEEKTANGRGGVYVDV